MPRRRPSLTAFLAALALCAASLGAGPAFAQAPPSAADKETARTLMNQGDDRFDAKDYAGALKAYQGADAIMHLPMTGIAVARAQAGLGMLLEALDVALQVTRIPAHPGENAKYAEARNEARTLAAALPARIPALDLQLSESPPGLVVSVDDAPITAAALGVPRKVNPGKHVVVARAPGFADARAEVSVAEGTTVPVPLKLVRGAGSAPPPPPGPVKDAPSTPPPSPPPPPPGSVSPLVYVGFGIGGASLIAGAVTGGLSLSKTSALAGECNTTTKVCATPAATGDLHTATTLANVSNATLGVGVAGAVVGIVGVVLSRRPALPTTALPFVGPGTVGVTGTF